MIDEKKLIEQLKGYKSEWKLAEPFHEGIASGLQIAIEATEKQPKVGEWIPCSERLPEEAGFYIVTKRQKSGEIQVALGSYRPLFNEWSGNGNFKDVLAWMPLPEPYRGDCNENRVD